MLVDDAFVKLMGRRGHLVWKGSKAFFADAVRAMRGILTDYERKERRHKRTTTGVSGAEIRLEDIPSESPRIDLLELDDVLARLARVSAEQSAILELRFFGGYTVAEAGEILGISVDAVRKMSAAALESLRNELADNEQRSETDETSSSSQRVEGVPSSAPAEQHTGTSERGAAPSTELPHIPGYTIGRRLGHGSFGTVYLAQETKLRRPVVLKVLSPDRLLPEHSRQRFMREIQALQGLRHHGIVPVYDYGLSEDGAGFIAMEYIPGGSLSQEIQDKRMAPVRAAQLLSNIAEAVHTLHQHGFVHRDLKPSNILLDRGGKPYLIDFGIVAKVHSKTEVAGTFAYMAPEFFDERVTPSSDIWALGVILYEMLAGQSPFSGTNTTELLTHVQNEAPRPPHEIDKTIPKELESICLRCLAKKPRDRYESAADLAAALRHFVDAADKPDLSKSWSGDRLTGTTAIDIEKLKSGDHEAFGRFMNEIQPRLRYSLYHRFGNRDEVEDIVQETLVDIFSRLNRLQDIDSVEKLKVFALRIALNKAIERHRRAARRVSTDSFPDKQLLAPSDDIQQRVLAEILQETIKALPEREQILIAHRVAGRTFQETAETLGCSKMTAHAIWARALTKIKKALKAKGVDV